MKYFHYHCIFNYFMFNLWEYFLRRPHSLEVHAQKTEAYAGLKMKCLFMPELDWTENIKVAFISLILLELQTERLFRGLKLTGCTKPRVIVQGHIFVKILFLFVPSWLRCFQRCSFSFASRLGNNFVTSQTWNTSSEQFECIFLCVVHFLHLSILTFF